jgi:hypothetical protein
MTHSLRVIALIALLALTTACSSTAPVIDASSGRVDHTDVAMAAYQAGEATAEARTAVAQATTTAATQAERVATMEQAHADNLPQILFGLLIIAMLLTFAGLRIYRYGRQSAPQLVVSSPPVQPRQVIHHHHAPTVHIHIGQGADREAAIRELWQRLPPGTSFADARRQLTSGRGEDNNGQR